MIIPAVIASMLAASNASLTNATTNLTLSASVSNAVVVEVTYKSILNAYKDSLKVSCSKLRNIETID